MPGLRFFARLPGALLLLVCLAGIARAVPNEPARPEVVALANQLIEAPDDATRGQLFAAAPAAVREDADFGRVMNEAWTPIIFTGDYTRAEKLGQYARGLLLHKGDDVDAAFALVFLGFIDGTRGDNQIALEKFSQAQAVFEAVGDKNKLARVLLGEAKVRLQLGDFQLALTETRHALAIYQEIHGKDGIINALNTSGSIFMAQGLPDRAMEYRQQALVVAGDDVEWQVYLFHNIANVYERRGQSDKAIEWMSKSVVLAKKVGYRPNLAAGLEELGGFHRKSGQLDLAESELREALQISEGIGEKRRQTSTLSSLAELLRQRGGEHFRDEALSDAERAAALARETGEPADIWRSCTLVGQLQLAAHQPDLARAAFEESIAAIEGARDHLAADDVGATAFLEDKLDAYNGMVALLTQANKPMAALAMAERAKARVLVDLLRGPRMDVAHAMTDAESATARRSAEQIAGLDRQIAAARAANDSTLTAELNAQLTVARRAREDAEEDFFIAHPELRTRRAPVGGGQLTPAELAGLVSDGKTTVLEYVVADDATYLFAVTKAADEQTPDVQVHRLSLDRTKLYDRARAFRIAVAERSLRWETGASALGRDLLGPVRELCARSEHLVIVADGPLWELPFQALILNADDETNRSPHTLWETCAVSFAPSLTFLTQLPAVAPLTTRPRLLAIGNPALASAQIVDGDLDSEETEPMPAAEKQAHELANLYGPAQSVALIGKAAHEDTFKDVSSGYDVLHFATHGFLNDTAPMYSRLLMAQTDLAPDEDGFLEAWEWLPLRLRARIVVLAACESGRGKVGAGEGMLGMSWALFQAGCPAVTVSQWSVDSASTTQLMINFHQHLLAGDRPSDALRSAALTLGKNARYQNPFYWAPFVVIGSDQPIVVKPR